MPTTYNKVVLDNTTLMDISDTTAIASDVASGKYFYAADGTKTLGTATGGTAAISVVDTTDSHGGTVRTITGLDISDTTAVASDVASGKYFYTADGTKTTGTASSGGGSSGQTATGTVTGTGTTTLEIPCSFAPDLIYVYGDLTSSVSLRGVVKFTIIKDTSITITNDASTSNTNEILYGSTTNITGYGDSNNPHATYSNNVLTLDMVVDSASTRFASDVTYTYELSTLGTASGGGGSSEPTYETVFNDSITVSENGISIASLADLYFAEGEMWRVTWDGTEYICQPAIYDGWMWTIGNQNLASAGVGTNEPFLLYNYGGGAMNGNAQTVGTHTLKLEKQTSSGSSSTNPLSGKILAVTGDSIAAGAGYTGGYAGIIGSEQGMIVQNIAVGGGTVAYINANVFCISRSISSMRSDADFVLLEGGGNDADSEVPLGTLSSGYTATLDDTTFAGAIESMFKAALARFPDKKIGYIFIHKCASGYDSRVPNSYYDMAKSACEKWGIPYLDLNTQIPPLNYIDDLRTTYTANADGYHPNELGYRTFYVPKITAFLNTMLTDNSLINKIITTNGTYSAQTDNADGYSSVTVNVPTGIIPTGTLNITANNTYDVTNYASAVVNVPSGGTPSATQHTIYFEFSDSTNTTITAYYDSTFISNAITATTPTTYDNKTVDSASLDNVVWYTRPTETWETVYEYNAVGYYPEENSYPYCWISELSDIHIAVGSVWRVTFDNVMYGPLTAWAGVDDHNGAFGNPLYLSGGSDDGSGVPFAFYSTDWGAWSGSANVTPETSHSVKIERLVTS